MRQQIAKTSKNKWVSKEVYPLIGIMGLSVVMVAYHAHHKLTGQDIMWRRHTDPHPFLKKSVDHNPLYIKVKSGDIEKYQV
ncbi:hypothetical protein AYI68_g3471 [Smittium mucronatum]|uniref:Uncharacterized protein n=1 Tax=Smittium mucronatum TaxID=133383 RepID=A0A1R0GZU1_9FUNG|nr:hypothetical protein AYI68_g8301 [Smittium mucronatum]OLY82412.1 hypothetical protein AYI68_g3471 [Smittium mucronatum]